MIDEGKLLPAVLKTGVDDGRSGNLADSLADPNDVDLRDCSGASGWRTLMSFWLLGLLNNSSFVIMIASAKSISGDAVGFVFLADTGPGLLMKASAPYWFDSVTYKTRILACTCCMAASFILVAVGESVGVQLLGVCLASVQSGMGEASVLALTTRYGGKQAGTHELTMWSSGTGFAGLFGYAWIVVFSIWMGIPIRLTTLMALILAMSYAAVFFFMLEEPKEAGDNSTGALLSNSEGSVNDPESAALRQSIDELTTSDTRDMSFAEKFGFLLSLWPFTVPLITIYFAEYALQSGVWSAIGFPVHSSSARGKFYAYAGWAYQLGVFFSRSSGSFFHPSMRVLWQLPIWQTGLLVFFIWDAAEHFWYNYGLLVPCFVVGLLGGAVYVHGFKLLGHSVKPKFRELAMASCSVSADLGILAASGMALLIQKMLYDANDITDDDS